MFAALYTLLNFKRNLASNIKINRKKEFESAAYAGILLKKIRRKDLLPLMLVRKQTLQSQDIFPFCKFRSSKSNLSHSSFAASVHVIVNELTSCTFVGLSMNQNPKKIVFCCSFSLQFLVRCCCNFHSLPHRISTVCSSYPNITSVQS